MKSKLLMKFHDNKSEICRCKKQTFLSVSFCLSILLITFTAIGLRPTLKFLERYYSKESIDPKTPMEKFMVSQLPSFQDGWNFKDAIVTEAVETDKYICTHLIRQDLYKTPRVANLFVTYYSDPNDKVAHSPDVCYRQEGAIVKKLVPIQIQASVAERPPSVIPAKLVIFEMPNGNQQVVIFTFYVEGVFRSKRWEVRWKIAKPGNRYTYFSKIESAVAFTNEEEMEDAINLSKQLITEAIPELTLDYFPSLEDISR